MPLITVNGKKVLKISFDACYDYRDQEGNMITSNVSTKISEWWIE